MFTNKERGIPLNIHSQPLSRNHDQTSPIVSALRWIKGDIGVCDTASVNARSPNGQLVDTVLRSLYKYQKSFTGRRMTGKKFRGTRNLRFLACLSSLHTMLAQLTLVGNPCSGCSQKLHRKLELLHSGVSARTRILFPHQSYQRFGPEFVEQVGRSSLVLPHVTPALHDLRSSFLWPEAYPIL